MYNYMTIFEVDNNYITQYLMVYNSWCNHNIQELKSFCSPNLEFLIIKCRPYYLPREFLSVILTAVYIPPQANTKTALKELHWTLCKLETIYPEAVFIAAKNFIKVNLTLTIPRWPDQSEYPSSRLF